jgi:hypothetical protein
MTNVPAASDGPTLKQVLNISDAAMDHAMGIAYQLYLTGHYVQAELVCKGLIACDHQYWWSHSLHASVLRRLGRDEPRWSPEIRPVVVASKAASRGGSGQVSLP